MLNNYVLIKPSKIFITLILIALIISLIIITLISCALWLKLFLLIFTSVYGVRIFWQHGLLKGHKAIQGLSFSADGIKIHVSTEAALVSLDGSTTLTSVLCILRFIEPNLRLRRSCVLWEDSLSSPFDLRKVRLLLSSQYKNQFKSTS